MRSLRNHGQLTTNGRARPVARIVGIGLLALVASLALAACQLVGDGPAGFVFGTDSTGVTVASSGLATEPAVGGSYGGYIGMIGDWARFAGCGSYPLAWSAADAAAAHRDKIHHDTGVGTGAYWFMGGPGVDPHYNGTTAEASLWGQRQAARALADMRFQLIDQPVVWMDVELPGSTVFDPVVDNGWTNVYTGPCTGAVSGSVTPALSRAEFDGFANYVTQHSRYHAGVYSSAAMWQQIFGTGSASSVTDTYEWAASPQTSALQPLPRSWCRSGTSSCAQFFGGITSSSKYALMWQWTGGGGTSNGVGDLDTIDVTRMAAIHLPAAAPPSPSSSILESGKRLTAGHELVSANNSYRAIMQGDGNFVVYQGNRALWSSGTENHPGAFVVMQSDGNLVVYDGTRPLWESNTWGNGPSYLIMQNDSNLVVYRDGQGATWSSLVPIPS